MAGAQEKEHAGSNEKATVDAAYLHPRYRSDQRDADRSCQCRRRNEEDRTNAHHPEGDGVKRESSKCHDSVVRPANALPLTCGTRASTIALRARGARERGPMPSGAAAVSQNGTTGSDSQHRGLRCELETPTQSHMRKEPV